MTKIFYTTLTVIVNFEENEKEFREFAFEKFKSLEKTGRFLISDNWNNYLKFEKLITEFKDEKIHKLFNNYLENEFEKIKNDWEIQKKEIENAKS